MDTATRHDQPAPRTAERRPVDAASERGVTAGHRWYRARIRSYGPLLGLVPMAVMGATALIALRVGEGRLSGLVGLIGGVSAAPGLLLAGAPLASSDNYLLATAASALLWLLLGLIASRRATVHVVASWRDYWRELTFLTIGVVLGALAALIAATQILGESILL